MNEYNRLPGQISGGVYSSTREPLPLTSEYSTTREPLPLTGGYSGKPCTPRQARLADSRWLDRVPPFRNTTEIPTYPNPTLSQAGLEDSRRR